MSNSILIIDDAPDQLLLMRAVFKMVDPNVEVSTSESGEIALQAIRDNPLLRPKVILMDLRMPGKDGKQMLSEIKSDNVLRVIPVCVFSNGDIDRDIADCYAAGASFYFRKPLGLESLKRFARVFIELWFGFASHANETSV